eukprot:CAMPEP_0172160614 /NCGR_PEP_ID=MMETSP1050-20130122/5655_1 /TAXON_ID=233186 /ORGANISM="Cryptomonas curvata, Strain CCAP979/52" /LENGTH=148 /DNA_ID=CAMNT_0012830395 /DNA_START=361 /DNA_END=804 /DNA_ORIENTATION=-
MPLRSTAHLHFPGNIHRALFLVLLQPLLADAFVLQQPSLPPQPYNARSAIFPAAAGRDRHPRPLMLRTARDGLVSARCAASGSSPPSKEPSGPPATDYYAVLHVPRDAPATRIKQAFRALSLKCHPDVISGGAADGAAAHAAFLRLSD